MKHTTILTTVAISLCFTSLGISSAQARRADTPAKQTAVNDVKKTKPRQERGRPIEDLGALTARGKELEKLYADTLKSLKAEIAAELPTIDESKKAACLEALQSRIAAEKNLNAKIHAHGLAIANKENDIKRHTKTLESIPSKVADAELMLKRAMGSARWRVQGLGNRRGSKVPRQIQRQPRDSKKNGSSSGTHDGVMAKFEFEVI